MPQKHESWWQSETLWSLAIVVAGTLGVFLVTGSKDPKLLAPVGMGFVLIAMRLRKGKD